jgi:hypothetical protein
MEIKNTIDNDDVEWEYHPGVTKDGKVLSPGVTLEPEMVFEEPMALAHLLMNEVVFLNSHWWKHDWPDEAKKVTSINVNCNDVFAWGCADAEPMMHEDIESLYRMWKKDPQWGASVWCILRRNEMPQKPVYDAIKKAGIWDLDQMGLGQNVTADLVEQYMRSLGKPKTEA